MGTTKNLIVATTAAMALAIPFIGAAEARQDRDRSYNQSIELRDQDYRRDISRRGERRFDRFGSLATPRIKSRIKRQMRRIRRGFDTGRISRFRSMRLRGRVFAIRTALRFAKLDGHVTRSERRYLNDLLDTNSRRIRRSARNGRDFRRIRY
ncbi:MAG: hypothetical protein JXQ99_29635 [Hyphomicrobiaceae bacterium]